MDNVEMILKEMKEAIVELNQGKAEKFTKKCIELNVPPEKIIEIISYGLKIVGDKYEAHEYFLPELIMAGTMMVSMVDLVRPLLIAKGVKAVGKVVMGTVKGDVHDLGKMIVIAMLKSAGFDVIDLGVDVTPEKFMKAVAQEKPDIMGMSALLSTTRVEMKNVVDTLIRAGLRDTVKIIIGGGAVTQNFASEIGADAYGKGATEAVRICQKLLEIKQVPASMPKRYSGN